MKERDLIPEKPDANDVFSITEFLNPMNPDYKMYIGIY
jgi:hypothetical protein